MVAGDAGGAINPFNGEGISYGYETGRIAACFVGEALVANDATELRGYEEQLQENYGLFYRTASVAMRAMGRPEVMRKLVSTGMHSRTLMEWVLRIMSNQLRPDEIAPAELAYRAISRLARTPASTGQRRRQVEAATAFAADAAAAIVASISPSPWASEQNITSYGLGGSAIPRSSISWKKRA